MRPAGNEESVRALRRTVTAVVALVGAATVLGLLDRAHWVFELGSVFRLQYAAVLVLAGLAAAALLRFRLAAVAALLAALNVVVIGPPPLAGDAAAAPPPARDALRLLVVNVEYGNREHDAVRRAVEEADADVVGVIELTPTWAAELDGVLRGHSERLLVPAEGAYGIGLYSRVPLLDVRVERFPAGEGPPTIVARAEVSGEPLTVVVTHVRTPFAGSIHARHLEALADARAGLGERLAVCGDFNTVPWAGPYRELAERGGLTTLPDGTLPDYSWPTWSPLLRVPLDTCLVSDGLAVAGPWHGPDVGSDHFPLVVDLTARP